MLFALAAVVLYYLFPKRLRQYVLLATSILFYLTYGVRMAGYLAATILLTYLFGLWLDRLAAFRPAAETKEERKRQKRANDRKKRRVLALSLVLNFASLALLKYGGFLAAAVNSVLGTELTLPHFLLPLGISFYIFQTSAYLIDISRGKHQAERGFLRYALFVCYFPQLVQGPINRFADLQPQLTEGNDFSWDNIQHGFLRMLYGVLKKAMIADTLAPIVAKIYGGYAACPGIICFLGAALYCIQLYCDFSGGIDLMMGISRLFGISMQENFCRPYFSVSLSDFWRRWHISLGEWMKDYLFYPLALSKPFGRLAQFCRRHMPLDAAKCIVPSLCTFLVFLAVGVWQGPGMANIAYGLWNGFWMSLAMFRAPIRKHLRLSIGHDRYYKDTQYSLTPHFGQDEITEMLDSGLISIGSHTYDMHQWPPYETVKPARENMLPLPGESETDYIHAVQTDAAREAETFTAFGIPRPDVLAFPEGAHADLTDVVLRECGYKVTLTTDESRVNTVVVGLPQTLIDLGRMTVLPGMTDEQLLQYLNERAN